jgi:hypothetical protein
MLTLCLFVLGIQPPPDTPRTYSLPTVVFGNGVPSAKIPKNTCDNARLERKLKKVLPVAKRAGQELSELNAQLASLPQREHKALVSATEKRLRDEFTGELENMTTSEGILLVRLLDRECGKSGYTIVKDLRNSFIAGMFQATARIFGQNLKDEWDPEKMICEEYLIQKIEREGEKK